MFSSPVSLWGQNRKNLERARNLKKINRASITGDFARRDEEGQSMANEKLVLAMNPDIDLKLEFRDLVKTIVLEGVEDQ
jgi:hypothetical protein